MYKVASAGEKERYGRYALRSYVEDNPRMTWCPSPGCEHSVQCAGDYAEGEPVDVTCRCSAQFCFNCKEEAHRPVRGLVVARHTLHDDECGCSNSAGCQGYF